MAEYTPNLNLLKKDPATDGNDTFNIKTMLNDNWDKIDANKKDQDDAINSIKDDIQNLDIPVKSVNNKTGDVVLNASDVGAETPEGAQNKASAALSTANNYTDTVAKTKVDKVAGKGLSTNDYTDAEKQKNQDNADNILILQQDFNEHKADNVSAHGGVLGRVRYDGRLYDVIVDETFPKFYSNISISEVATQLLVEEDYFYITNVNGRILRLDKCSGSPLFSSDFYNFGGALDPMVIVGDYIYAGSRATGVLKLRKLNKSNLSGGAVAETDYFSNNRVLQTDGEYLYVMGSEISKLNLSDLSVVAEIQSTGYANNTFHIDDSYVYAMVFLGSTYGNKYELRKYSKSSMSQVASVNLGTGSFRDIKTDDTSIYVIANNTLKKLDKTSLETILSKDLAPYSPSQINITGDYIYINAGNIVLSKNLDIIKVNGNMYGKGEIIYDGEYFYTLNSTGDKVNMVINTPSIKNLKEVL